MLIAALTLTPTLTLTLTLIGARMLIADGVVRMRWRNTTATKPVVKPHPPLESG